MPGDLIGGIIGGVGSLIGGGKKASADKQAAQQSLTGFNYLTGPNGTQSYVSQGTAAGTAQADLLGVNGAAGSERSAPAFQNYLNSTGYDFQMDQGQRAITGSAAARGILNSGATAKALTGFGQGLASTSFNNYLGQLGGVANRGLDASGQIGAAGTAGGGNAAVSTRAAGEAQQEGITGLTGAIAGGLVTPTATNYFRGL